MEVVAGRQVKDEVECKELSHVEAMKRVHELQSFLLSDRFLQDLPEDVSLDEVQSQLALEQGRAISLQLRRFDDEIICEWKSVRVCTLLCNTYT